MNFFLRENAVPLGDGKYPIGEKLRASESLALEVATDPSQMLTYLKTESSNVGFLSVG